MQQALLTINNLRHHQPTGVVFTWGRNEMNRHPLPVQHKGAEQSWKEFTVVYFNDDDVQ